MFSLCLQRDGDPRTRTLPLVFKLGLENLNSELFP